MYCPAFHLHTVICSDCLLKACIFIGLIGLLSQECSSRCCTNRANKMCIGIIPIICTARLKEILSELNECSPSSVFIKTFLSENIVSLVTVHCSCMVSNDTDNNMHESSVDKTIKEVKQIWVIIHKMV